MSIYKSFEYRLYPTKKQKELLDNIFGCVRLVYNLALETKIDAWKKGKSLSGYDLTKQLPGLKELEKCDFLNEVPAESLCESILDLDKAYQNFFNGKGYPKFKSKEKSKESFRACQGVKIEKGRLSITNFRKGNSIKINLDRPYEGKIKFATIKKTRTGKYLVSLCCDTGKELPPKPPIKEDQVIGVDLGIKYLLITSEGVKFENPKFLEKELPKLKRLQRSYSKNKGKKTKKRIAKLHEDIKNKRKDYLHKLSTTLIRENQTICVETLRVKNMVKNHKLARRILDAAWGMVVEMLTYKSGWEGVNLLKIGTFEPSSKTCFSCGAKNEELELDDRVWTCQQCGTTHDRDINAAKNIKAFALKKLCGTHS